MRALIQRTTGASVKVDDEVIGEIGTGLVVFLGVKFDDREEDIDYLVEKICGLRIFSDAEGKFNDSLEDLQGSVLIISQFTLYADTRKGRRPGFTGSARPETAIPLYETFISKFKARGIQVQCGRFGADMKVSLLNDGPVTVMLDSEDKFPRKV